MMEGAPVMEPVGAMLGVAVSLGEVEGVPVGEHSASGSRRGGAGSAAPERGGGRGQIF